MATNILLKIDEASKYLDNNMLWMWQTKNIEISKQQHNREV